MTLLRALIVGALAIPLLAWVFDDAWAIPMIIAAPNEAGTRQDSTPADARVIVSERAGEHIEAWVLEPRAEPLATVLVLHGIRDRKASMLSFGRTLTADGFRAVLVDLRGHGASSGACLTYGVADAGDLRGLIDELDAADLLTQRLGVFGVSYGAATAVLLAASEPRIDAVVALAPFASLRDVVPGYVRLIAGDFESLVPDVWMNSVIDRAGEACGFDPDLASPAARAVEMRAALFVAHGGADRRIPAWHGERIERGRRAASTRRVVYPEATHGTIGAHGTDDARAFLREELSSRAGL